MKNHPVFDICILPNNVSRTFSTCTHICTYVWGCWCDHFVVGFSAKEQNWFSQLEKYSCSNLKATLDQSGGKSLVKIVIASLARPRRSILEPVFHQEGGAPSD